MDCIRSGSRSSSSPKTSKGQNRYKIENLYVLYVVVAACRKMYALYV
jgi:hypothetical protein